MRNFVKLLVVAAIVFALWKYGVPWFQQNFKRNSGDTTQAAADTGCPQAAQAATNAWGGGIGRFVNPPYDISAWDTFRSDVEAKIQQANDACSGESESFVKARSAMTDLSSLVSDLDTSIRNGTAPPDDVVRRQESIDNRIDEAAALTAQGK